MAFLRRLFGGASKMDGEQLARSDVMGDYAQIDLLACFVEPRGLHTGGEQTRWSRALPLPYEETIRRLQQAGWLEVTGADEVRATPAAMPFVQLYGERLALAKMEAMAKVRAALAEKQAGDALAIRRAYEAFFPLGKAGWTGPEPQLSHSALTRRILFLDDARLTGLSRPSADWLKLYAAEQHLWGAYWRLAEEEIPAALRQEVARPDMETAEAVYWRAYQLALYVDNQETWQRCKGGDHVRRMEIVGPDDLCDVCAADRGKEYLVARVPELPHAGCTCVRGCCCRYEPVLETLDEPAV